MGRSIWTSMEQRGRSRENSLQLRAAAMVADFSQPGLAQASSAFERKQSPAVEIEEYRLSVRKSPSFSSFPAPTRLAPALLVALCFVFASIASAQAVREWAWMGGSSQGGQSGVYGTLGTPAAGNIPGGRSGESTWIDSSGNLWLFGALGAPFLNDLWKFNPSTSEWTWMAGSQGDQSGIYGTLGTPGVQNTPGSRGLASAWSDSKGNLWLFGGYGDIGNGAGFFNDLWEFNTSTNEWAWMGGSSKGDHWGVYGTLGTPASWTIPGAREAASTWTDSEGHFWLFGGLGFDSEDISDYLNDLWEFDPSTNEWTWMAGSNTVDKAGVYGTLRTPAAGNTPGSRNNASTWRDSSGNLWLFGGLRVYADGTQAYRNDLWEFNPSTNEWTWMAGSNEANEGGVYGTLNTPAAGNTPGARDSALTWIDSEGNLWLFGGYFIDQYNPVVYNDVWEFNPSTNEWAWMGGSSTPDQTGVYGTLGLAGAQNFPGARETAGAWTDSRGDFWLFGGYGIVDVNGDWGYLNDLWSYQPLPVGAAELTSPLPGIATVLPTGNVTFQWTSGSGVTAYRLELGATLGSAKLFDSGQITTTSAIVSGLPTNGVPLYARLSSLISGTWQHIDYVYTESGSPTLAAMISPAPGVGTVLGANNVTFQWTAGAGPTAYSLELGTSKGSANVLNTGQILTTSVTVPTLPANGVTLYARLMSKIDGAWQYNDYVYTEWGGTPAAIISPTPGVSTVLPSGNVTFQWTSGTNVTAYELELGTAPGSANLFNSGQIATTSAIVSGLPSNGATLYARLSSLINGAWQYNDYTYTAYFVPAPPVLISPVPGLSTVIGTSNVTFTWTAGMGNTGYGLWVGVHPGGHEIANVGTPKTSVTVPTLPANGVTLYVTLLWTTPAGGWQTNDYVYTESGTIVPSVLTTPSPGLSTVLGTSNVTFEWTAGTGPLAWALELGTAPGSANLLNTGQILTTSVTVPTLPANGVTLYARLMYKINQAWQYHDYVYTESGTTTLAAMTNPTPGVGTVLGTSDVTFQWTAGAGPTAYALELGTAPGSANLLNTAQILTTSVTVPTLPANGVTLYARLMSKIDGAWQYHDYVYTESGSTNLAAMTNPTPGVGTVLGTSDVTFQWTAGAGPTAYALELGTAPGSANLLNTAQILTTSVTVPTLPANGVTLYARLMSKIDGAWQYHDYVYTESGTTTLAVMTSPTPGVGTVLGSSNVTFQWTQGAGPSAYALELGTAPGSANLFNTAQILTTSVTVPTLPANGVTLYARLFSKIDGAWQYNDYVYTEQ